MLGLLHDAPEAYLGDMIQPLKRKFPQFKEAEFDMWELVATRFGLSLRQPENVVEVKEADCRALATERRDLLNPGQSNWSWGIYDSYEPFPEIITPLAPHDAELAFLARFHALNA